MVCVSLLVPRCLIIHDKNVLCSNNIHTIFNIKNLPDVIQFPLSLQIVLESKFRINLILKDVVCYVDIIRCNDSPCCGDSSDLECVSVEDCTNILYSYSWMLHKVVFSQDNPAYILIGGSLFIINNILYKYICSTFKYAL